jgi:hypothetical protein
MDPDFRVEVINAMPDPNITAYLAMHQDYSENFVYDESRIIECDVLVTHSAPQHIGPNDRSGIKYWCEVDKKLWDECLTERHYHNKLLAACRPKAHYCGHFHVSDSVEKDGCISRILDILEIKEHIGA